MADKLHPQSDISLKNISTTDEVKNDAYNLGDEISSFDVLLTVHLSILILVINQLDAQNLFHNKFISCLYMFRASCARRLEVKIVLYSLWYHHTETSEWSKITKITKFWLF